MPSSKYPGQRSKGLMIKCSRVPIMPCCRGGDDVQIVDHFSSGLKYLATDISRGNGSFLRVTGEIASGKSVSFFTDRMVSAERFEMSQQRRIKIVASQGGTIAHHDQFSGVPG